MTRLLVTCLITLAVLIPSCGKRGDPRPPTVVESDQTG